MAHVRSLNGEACIHVQAIQIGTGISSDESHHGLNYEH